MTERNTFDWGSLEESHSVAIGKALADEVLVDLTEDLGHPLCVDERLPVREVEDS